MKFSVITSSAAFENFLLRSAVPKAWYSLKNLQKKASATANDHPLGISGFGLSNADLTAESSSTGTESKQPAATSSGSQRMEPTEVRLHNTNQFRNVLTDMCACLMPIFQGLHNQTSLMIALLWHRLTLNIRLVGLTKMSVTRRLMDNDQKKEAFKLAELMSTVIKENITFERICKLNTSSTSCHGIFNTNNRYTTHCRQGIRIMSLQLPCFNDNHDFAAPNGW